MNINFHGKISKMGINDWDLIESPSISAAEKYSRKIRFSVRGKKGSQNYRKTEKTGLGDSTISKRTRDFIGKSRNDKKIFEERHRVELELKKRLTKGKKKNDGSLRACRWASPKKIPHKYKIGMDLWRVAPQKQVRNEQRKLTQKERIIQNIFYKNEKYYYSDKVNFSAILKKIYYENYRIEDIKDYILPCFKKLGDERTFFETLIREARSFAEAVRNVLSKKVYKLLKNPGENQKDSSNLNQQTHKFKEFCKHSKKYIETIDLLFAYYKHLETINFEIDKLTKIYLENYIDREKQLSLNTLRFHQKMFINCVYNDSIIHDVIFFLIKFVENNNFSGQYYTRSEKKIYEMYENLELSLNEQNESFSSELAPQDSLYSSKEFSKDEVLVLSDEIKKREEFQLHAAAEKHQLEQKERAEKKKLKQRRKRQRKKNNKLKKILDQKQNELLQKDLDLILRMQERFNQIDKIFESSSKSLPEIVISFNDQEKSFFKIQLS